MASSTSQQSKGRYVPAASLLLLLLVWWGASALTAAPDLFPSPVIVVKLIVEEALSGELWQHLGATLARVLAAFVLAMSIGAVIGIVMGMKRSVNRWADPWLVVALNLPALVTIVLCYIWIGLTEVAAVTAVAINKIPLVATILREGARTLDRNLADMAQVFDINRWSRFRHVILPQLAPHFAASARAGVALIWKIVLVVEFLGRSNGVGFMIHLHFQNFDVGMVLAYSLSFIAVMVAIEIFVLQPWERSVSRWRRV